METLMLKTLTRKQKAVYDEIISYIEKEGCFPTYAFLIERFGFKSPNSVTQNLQALTKKGYLRFDKFGYVIKNIDHNACPYCGSRKVN